MPTPDKRQPGKRGWSAWTLLGSVLVSAGAVGPGAVLWQAGGSMAGRAPAAETAVAPATPRSLGSAQASSPRDQAVAPPVASVERLPGSSSGPHPNWHGRWQGESEGSRLDIGPGGISKTSLHKEQDGKESMSTEHCKWTAKTEPSEGGCRSGYAVSSKALSLIQAEFEQSVEAHRRDPVDFKITDPVRARQAFSAIRPGSYRVVWAEGEGDCSRFEMIIDADTILSTMQCHYGHDIERFSRIR